MSRISVRAIIHKEGKFLLTRLRQYPDFWCLPGGGLGNNESIFDCLKREIVEELGIEPSIGRLLYIHQIKNGAGFLGPEFFFEVVNSNAFEDINLEKTKLGKSEIEKVGFKDAAAVELLPGFLQKELPEIYGDDLLQEPTRMRISETEE
jgi:8-oxo-dGTP pyrophosphatase MutT (NUDIX family)